MLKDFGSLLQIYKNNEMVDEIYVSKMQKAGNAYIMAAVGITVDFFLRDETLVFFQHTPNQIKIYDLSSKKFLEDRKLQLSSRGRIEQVIPMKDRNYLLLIIDPENPTQLGVCQYDIVHETITIVWQETLKYTVRDGLLGWYDSKLVFLGAGETTLLLYDFASEVVLTQKIPEIKEREYEYRPEFKSENPFEWADLSRKEKSRFLSDYYKSFLLVEDDLFACHYVYQRDNFDVPKENYFFSKNKIGQPITESGFLENVKYFQFGSSEHFVLLIKNGDEYKMKADRISNIGAYMQRN